VKQKIIEILVGIPCSGKSTYTKNLYYNSQNHSIFYVSRDEIRKRIQEYNYKHTEQNEKKVTEQYNEWVRIYLSNSICEHLILDNTHCKEKYIDEIIQKYKDNYTIKVTYFECSLLKAYYRNITRYFDTGKWIPFGVIKQMNRNFKKINRSKYKKYENS
jgi:predicted ABC-type ATPase